MENDKIKYVGKKCGRKITMLLLALKFFADAHESEDDGRIVYFESLG